MYTVYTVNSVHSVHRRHSTTPSTGKQGRPLLLYATWPDQSGLTSYYGQGETPGGQPRARVIYHGLKGEDSGTCWLIWCYRTQEDNYAQRYQFAFFNAHFAKHNNLLQKLLNPDSNLNTNRYLTMSMSMIMSMSMSIRVFHFCSCCQYHPVELI